MDENRLAAVTQSLTSVPSRRDVLRGLVGAGLGLGTARLPDAAAKKKRKKVRFNAFGCVNVGDFCKNPGQCCSGICQGKPGKKKCRAHDMGGCQPGAQDGSCTEPGTDVLCTTSAGNEGYCNTTTGNAGFCAYSGGCYPCTKDVECQDLYGPQAACIHCDDCLQQTGGTSCAHA